MRARYRNMLKVLEELGETTTRQIAQRVKLSVSGTSQSLKSLARHGHVKHVDGKGGDMKWQLLKIK